MLQNELVPPLLPLLVPGPLLGAVPKPLPLPLPLNGFCWPLLLPGLVLVGDCAFDVEAVRFSATAAPAPTPAASAATAM